MKNQVYGTELESTDFSSRDSSWKTIPRLLSDEEKNFI